MPGPLVEIDVRDEGAIGDGNPDHAAQDTAGFLSAIAKARETRGTTVRVPPGRYYVNQTLRLRNQTLRGDPVPGWGSDSPTMPTVVPRTATTDPCVVLDGGGVVSGLLFDCDQNPDEHKKATIQLVAHAAGSRIDGVRISNAWDGIAAQGDDTNTGRSIIQNCFLHNIRNIGVAIGTRGSGAPHYVWLSNVDVWSNDDNVVAQSGFEFGAIDGISVSSCNAFRCKVGFTLWHQPGKGGTAASFSNCQVDFSNNAFLVFGRHHLNITGGIFWCHNEALKIEGGGGRVIAAGAEFSGNGAPAVHVVDGELISLSGCLLRREFPTDQPAVRLAKVQGASITGCLISVWQNTTTEIENQGNGNVALAGNTITRVPG